MPAPDDAEMDIADEAAALGTSELSGEFLYQLKAVSGMTRREICEMTGLTMGQVGGRIWRYRQTMDGAPQERTGVFDIILGKPLELSGDFVVVSDVHAPTTDLDMARLVVPVAELHGIRQLLILGDLINIDWASSYPMIVPLPAASQEIRAAGVLLEGWLHYFDAIYWLPGNHEDRFMKLNNGNLSMNNLVRMVSMSDKLKVSDLDHCTIDTPAGRWFCCHGTDYSINTLWQANWYEQKYRAHIIIGHQHHLAIGYDRYKHHIIVDNGGLFDPDKMAYVKMRANKKARMQKGFTALVNGCPYLYGPYPFTDWERVFEQLDIGSQPAARRWLAGDGD